MQAEPHSADQVHRRSAEAGGSWASASSTSRSRGGVQLFSRDPVGERDLGRSVGAGPGVLFIDRCQAFRREPFRDPDKAGH